MELANLEIPFLTLTPLERGTNKNLIFTTYQNDNKTELFTELTDAKIKFELKRSKTSVNIFLKKTANDGGDDTQIKVNSSSEFSLFLQPTDTESLMDGVYWGLFTILETTGKIYKRWIQIPFI